MSTVNRQNGRGDGLALVYNKEIKVKLKEQECRQSFEFGKWQVHLGKKTIMVTKIYHPLYLGHNLITNNIFINDLI